MKVLSRVFRGKFRVLLERAFARGELGFFGELAPLAEAAAFRRFLAAATGREWVVYAMRPFSDATCVLKYLARYTHRVAISNSRLLEYRAGVVTFRPVGASWAAPHHWNRHPLLTNPTVSLTRIVARLARPDECTRLIRLNDSRVGRRGKVSDSTPPLRSTTSCR